MGTTVVALSCFALNSAATRHLLQGGGVSDDGTRSDADYSYVINIWIDYDWNINETIENYTIEYLSLWSGIKELIDQQEFDIEEIEDKTLNKHDLIYTYTKAQELFDTNSKETLHIEIDITSDKSDAAEKLQNYVREDLSNDITIEYDQTGGLLNIIDVRCSIEGNNTMKIMSGTIIGSFALCCICIWTYLYCCIIKPQLQPKVKQITGSTEKYINDSKCVKNNDYNPFIDGNFSGYYKQYGKNYPIKNFELRFVDGMVSGNGEDKVGEYIIKGKYSEQTQRMALDKEYILGTGDPKENLGHTVNIRLEYNGNKSEFCGDWYVKTYKYEGSGEWVLRLCGLMNTEGYKTKNKDNDQCHDIHINEKTRRNIDETDSKERESSLDVNIGDLSHLEDIEVQEMYDHLPSQWVVSDFIKRRERERERQIIQYRVRVSEDHTKIDELE